RGDRVPRQLQAYVADRLGEAVPRGEVLDADGRLRLRGLARAGRRPLGSGRTFHGADHRAPRRIARRRPALSRAITPTSTSDAPHAFVCQSSYGDAAYW